LSPEQLRVSGQSRPNAVAGAIAALLRSQGQVEVQAIGPAAVNQAVKAIAIARGYLAGNHLDLTVQPAFVKLDPAAVPGTPAPAAPVTEERTALCLMVFAYRTDT
jgi:stage V sporulation protein S